MSECICKGNWRKIIKEFEPLMNKIYINDRDGQAYRFIGVLHAPDDYYYCMVSMTGEQNLLSCVGSIENYGYELEDK